MNAASRDDSSPAGATHQFKRARNQRVGRRTAPPHTPERFQSEVLAGKLWHAACQDARRSELEECIPLQFGSTEEYISTFDALVLEEAREGLRADWAEACAAMRVWPVHVRR